MDLNKVYLLQHSYDYGKESEHQETKILGIYSSKEIAEQMIKEYSVLPGFNEFDEACFYIDEYEINKKEWVTGFVQL